MNELERQIKSKRTSIELMLQCVGNLTYQLDDLLNKQQELIEQEKNRSLQLPSLPFCGRMEMTKKW